MSQLVEIATITLSTPFGEFLATTFETKYADQPYMHYVLFLRTATMPQVPLVRIQSSCLFGETFQALDCDCGEQLEQSLTEINHRGGILFYLDQEGRGHNLFNKTRELHLQQTRHLDTVEASEELHLEPDMRKFTVVGDILKQLNVSQIELLTNNPHKLSDLEKQGIVVTRRVPLEIEPNDYNKKYLLTKKQKLGHLLTKYFHNE